MSEYTLIVAAIKKQGNKKRAINCARFFKTGPGQYGESDIFLGLTVPMSRVIAQTYKHLSLPSIQKLLASKIHEERFIALLILIDQYTHGNKDIRKKIFDFYLSHTKYINNWDLVDVSADKIVGDYLYKKPTHILKKLAGSQNMWERRIAMVATFASIKKGEYITTFAIAQILLKDQHDLIHKASGWMLREVGKRISFEPLRSFLNTHAATMPRTMLRYALEHLPTKERHYYLTKKL